MPGSRARERRRVQHVDVVALEARAARAASRMRCARASSSRRDRHRWTPPGWRSATSMPVAAQESRREPRPFARRALRPRAVRRHPRPLPCTQISPKLPRDARYARSPSSRIASRGPRSRSPNAIAAPTSPPPMTATSTCCHAAHAREAQDRRNLRYELRERVVAAALHVLVRAAVIRDGLAIVEHLVAGLDQQEVALGTRDARDRERAQLVEVRAASPRTTRPSTCWSACPRTAAGRVRAHRRIDQHRARAEALGEMRRVVPAERAPDEGDGRPVRRSLGQR